MWVVWQFICYCYVGGMRYYVGGIKDWKYRKIQDAVIITNITWSFGQRITSARAKLVEKRRTLQCRSACCLHTQCPMHNDVIIYQLLEITGGLMQAIVNKGATKSSLFYYWSFSVFRSIQNLISSSLVKDTSVVNFNWDAIISFYLKL